MEVQRMTENATGTGRAAKYAKRIKANVDAFYDDEIGIDMFGARQVALWNEINQHGRNLADAVSQIVCPLR